MIKAEPEAIGSPQLERELWCLYRDFFDRAEKKRRWSIRDDIPWNECNPNLKPAIADVVETFCAVELYLPDYISKILPLVRASKGRAWFYANWGYEESKHSLTLGDWLLRSGHRTEEQMTELERKVFDLEWNLPHDSALGMLAYAMVQEHATFLNYRNLRNRVEPLGGDPALEKLLLFVSVDEKAHYGLFRDIFKIFLDFDRDTALVALERVLHTFQMPAIHDLLDNRTQRMEKIRDMEIFTEEIFFRDVYLYVLNELGVSKHELRKNLKAKKSQLTG